MERVLSAAQENALHDYLYAHEADMCRDLMRLVRYPSVKGAPAPGAPFGPDSRRLLDEVKALFADHGLEATIEEDMYLYVDLFGEGSDEMVGVFAHGDVVPVDDNWLVTKPFEPVLIDGYMYGRGIRDNKVAVIYALYTALAVKELGLPFAKKYRIFVGSNEEAGMEDIKAYVKNHGYPDYGLVVDSSFPCVRGEKSFLRYSAISPKLCDVKDISGGLAYNVVLGEVSARLDEKYYDILEKNATERITLRRDDSDVIVTARGLSRHASAPAESLNAMYLLAELFVACGIDADIMREAAKVLAEPFGVAAGVACSDETFGKLTMANGIVRVIDGKLSLTFDTRFAPCFVNEEIAEKVNAYFTGIGWTTEIANSSHGYIVPEDDPKVLAAIDEYERFTGNTECKSRCIGGGTYSRRLGGKAVAVGLELRVNQKEFPAGHGGAHQPDEAIEVLGILRCAELIARMLIRFGN